MTPLTLIWYWWASYAFDFSGDTSDIHLTLTIQLCFWVQQWHQWHSFDTDKPVMLSTLTSQLCCQFQGWRPSCCIPPTQRSAAFRSTRPRRRRLWPPSPKFLSLLLSTFMQVSHFTHLFSYCWLVVCWLVGWLRGNCRTVVQCAWTGLQGKRICRTFVFNFLFFLLYIYTHTHAASYSVTLRHLG